MSNNQRCRSRSNVSDIHNVKENGRAEEFNVCDMREWITSVQDNCRRASDTPNDKIQLSFGRVGVPAMSTAHKPLWTAPKLDTSHNDVPLTLSIVYLCTAVVATKAIGE